MTEERRAAWSLMVTRFTRRAGLVRPGDRFEAPAEEIARLTKSGHIADPRRRVVVRPGGGQLLYRAKEFVPR